MTQARQWFMLVQRKNEAGVAVCRQDLTASNSYEAIQMAEALHGNLLLSECAFPA